MLPDAAGGVVIGGGGGGFFEFLGCFVEYFAFFGTHDKDVEPFDPSGPHI